MTISLAVKQTAKKGDLFKVRSNIIIFVIKVVLFICCRRIFANQKKKRERKKGNHLSVYSAIRSIMVINDNFDYDDYGTNIG